MLIRRQEADGTQKNTETGAKPVFLFYKRDEKTEIDQTETITIEVAPSKTGLKTGIKSGQVPQKERDDACAGGGVNHADVENR